MRLVAPERSVEFACLVEAQACEVDALDTLVGADLSHELRQGVRVGCCCLGVPERGEDQQGRVRRVGDERLQEG